MGVGDKHSGAWASLATRMTKAVTTRTVRILRVVTCGLT